LDINDALDRAKVTPTAENLKAVESAQEYAVNAANKVIDAVDNARDELDNASKSENIKQSNSSDGNKKCYVVDIKKLSIYDSASKYGEKIGFFAQGQVFCPLSEKGNWFEVENGWVAGTFVTETDAPESNININSEAIEESIAAALKAAEDAKSAASHSEETTDAIISNLTISSNAFAENAENLAKKLNLASSESLELDQLIKETEKAASLATKALNELKNAADAVNEDVSTSISSLKIAI